MIHKMVGLYTHPLLKRTNRNTILKCFMNQEYNMKVLSTICIFLMLAGWLSGCGQKGALYLPKPGEQPVQSNPLPLKRISS